MDDESNFVFCDEFYIIKVWYIIMFKFMIETVVRFNDVNEDGVDDFMVGFLIGVDVYNVFKIFCDLYFNGIYLCYGGFLVFDGKIGREIWRYYIMYEIYLVNCNGDLDVDGVRDCLIFGRVGVF